MAIANRVLDLWRDGYYTPGPAYPYTLEETLLELQEGLKAKGNYEAWFQPFTPANGAQHVGNSLPRLLLWLLYGADRKDRK